MVQMVEGLTSGDRYRIFASKSSISEPKSVTGNIVRYDALAPRPTVPLLFSCVYGNQLVRVFVLCAGTNFFYIFYSCGFCFRFFFRFFAAVIYQATIKKKEKTEMVGRSRFAFQELHDYFPFIAFCHALLKIK